MTNAVLVTAFLFSARYALIAPPGQEDSFGLAISAYTLYVLLTLCTRFPGGRDGAQPPSAYLPMPAQPKNQFVDTRYYDKYKAIRNRFRKYDSIGIVALCLEYLHQPALDRMSYLNRQPWLVVLLMKWVLADENAPSRGRPWPTKPEAVALMQSVLDIGGKARLPSQYDHTRLFMRAIAYQQFIYQRSTSLFAIARQLLYFDGLAAAHYIPSTFKAITGLELRRFLELSEILLLRFSEDSTVTTVDTRWFSNLGSTYPAEEVKAFLECLTQSAEEVRQRVLTRDRMTIEQGLQPRSPTEYYEQSPFIDYPLIRHGSGYVCIDRHLLFRCIERYVYNRLRTEDSNRFMSSFGPLFESYVGQAVRYLNLPYVAEVQLDALLDQKRKTKIVDFLIADGDANIFVDAKAVEMAYQGKGAHESLVLAKWLGTSAFKAVEQAHAVIHALPDNADDEAIVRRRGANYLIAVTYSELYVGNGRILAEAVGMPAVEAIIAKYPHDTHIPLENMFFMTIVEFECLAAAVHDGVVGLASALEKAKAADVEPQSRKFEFQQHLSEWGVGESTPTYVREKALSEMARLGGKLNPSCRSTDLITP